MWYNKKNLASEKRVIAEEVGIQLGYLWCGIKWLLGITFTALLFLVPFALGSAVNPWYYSLYFFTFLWVSYFFGKMMK